MVTNQKQYRVFVSYSRKDAPLVQHLVSLLRAIDTVPFLDEQSIDAGANWRADILSALEQCERVLVFWCEHSAESDEVRKEYLFAISLQKRVVPVLVDATAMPEEIGRFQAVDLRETVGGFHDMLVEALAFWEAGREGRRFNMTTEDLHEIDRAQVTYYKIMPEIEREFVTQARRLLETL
jgi:TIR domain-containing protein